MTCILTSLLRSEGKDGGGRKMRFKLDPSSPAIKGKGHQLAMRKGKFGIQ
jgi:hypothetical protein